MPSSKRRSSSYASVSTSPSSSPTLFLCASGAARSWSRGPAAAPAGISTRGVRGIGPSPTSPTRKGLRPRRNLGRFSNNRRRALEAWCMSFPLGYSFLNYLFLQVFNTQAQASYVAGSPYPSRSPRAHPSGWTRTQGLSRRDSHAPPSLGRPPSGCGTGRLLVYLSASPRYKL